MLPPRRSASGAWRGLAQANNGIRGKLTLLQVAIPCYPGDGFRSGVKVCSAGRFAFVPKRSIYDLFPRLLPELLAVSASLRSVFAKQIYVVCMLYVCVRIWLALDRCYLLVSDYVTGHINPILLGLFADC